MTNEVLIASHMLEAENNNAEFYNCGWASGEDFIHSKTSQGRLYSEIDSEGNITHEWQKPKACVLCGAYIEGFGNNPAPLADKGLACDHCNATKVIVARISLAKR